METDSMREAAKCKLRRGIWAVSAWIALFALSLIFVVLTVIGQANPEPGDDLQATIGWRVFGVAVCGVLIPILALLMFGGVSVLRTEWQALRHLDKP